MLFNEPKLLKSNHVLLLVHPQSCFSALQRAEIAEIRLAAASQVPYLVVSVLFNEPKLLKCLVEVRDLPVFRRFSALQRAEIAEIIRCAAHALKRSRFSALQRAEIAEIRPPLPAPPVSQIPIPARRRS